MKIKNIIESTGGTTAGAVASVAMPMSGVQKRQGSLFKGKKTKKQFYEGKMKDLSYDIQYLDAGNFKKKYGMTKEEMVKSLKDRKSYVDDQKYKVSEAELSEQDLIIVPGMRKSKDTSFIPHEKDRRDHEVEMARSDLYATAKDAMRIFKLLKDRSEDEGIMGWQQSYITLAADYLNSVADSIEYDARTDEMTGGVIAGGMSNLEESNSNSIQQTYDAVYQKLMTDPQMQQIPAREMRNMILTVMGYGEQIAVRDLAAYAYGNFRTKGKLKRGVAEGRPWNPLDYERSEEKAMDQERRRFKWDELSAELKGEEEQARKYNQGPWYLRVDGKLLKDKNKNPYTFNTLEAARKAANTMMKKDWNIGKNFSYSQTPTDQKIGEASQQPDRIYYAELAPVGFVKIKAIDANDAYKQAAKLWYPDEFEKIISNNLYKTKKLAVYMDPPGGDEYVIKKQKTKESKSHKCPECGGELVSEELMNEKKDACYYKVKSRYKVWPSAYASGALVKCRKKGASNWGTGGKSNESVAEKPLDEKWSKKYKDSINCKNPKGFSQKAHCAGRKK